MSVGNIEAHSAGGYNFYVVNTEGKRFVIGGVPESFSDEYIAVAASCDAAVLLTSKPEFTGGLGEVIRRAPDIKIYGGSACLRNIKEILNSPVNEELIKDNMAVCGIRFTVTPNLHWVDSVMALYGGTLFSGEAFSSLDGEDGLKEYFDRNIAVNKPYVRTALEKLKKEDISVILPATGARTDALALDRYAEWSAEKPHAVKMAVIIYSSRYGYTRELALRAAAGLEKNCEVRMYDAETVDTADAVNAVNAADMLLVGTNTADRNAPRAIWDIITRIDLVNKRGMPYFVFGSFGWAGDGIKLVDKTLAAMGLRRAAKPVEVLFRPEEKDLMQIDKAADMILKL